MKHEFKCRNLFNVSKNKATVIIIFLFLVSIHQVSSVYNREIQCLADFLKPEECEKLLAFSDGDSLKATNYNNSIECFQRLANWTLHLKWKQKDTYAMLKNRFRQIGGRTNLVSLIHNCFTRFRREIVDETIDDWGEDGEKSNLEESFTKGKKEEREEGQSEGKFSNSLRSRSIFSSLNSTSSDYPCLKLNPYIILGIVGIIVLCVCCSTLVIRRKLANCFKCCKRKKKPKKSSGKYSPIDAEKGKKSPRKKKMSFSSKAEERNDESSKVLINTATQDSNPSVRRVEEESPPSGCCQCCKKKKKKRKKSTRRKK
ncbi:uncharacterized protein LOC122509330 isoform X2 [Leptopilina heterotoma]|uniref:uncharacterized protein LOC122509330 isoform X2 n=1 Tax=Leptopilina heterotoma TaxID=63436 RepID=UPI001CA7E607|nr:uncharacterized protein LOC122509330 isoform X2 [Leptopilina heterotoma]